MLKYFQSILFFLVSACLISCIDLSSQSKQGRTSTWLSDVSMKAPLKLSQLGFIKESKQIIDFENNEILENIHQYQLDYNLYSDSLFKIRHYYLPEEGPNKINIKVGGEFQFPNGTVFFKTFLREENNQRRPVETRILYQIDQQWLSLTYQWDEDSRDATLMNGRGADIKFLHFKDSVDYHIPNRLECANCHLHEKGSILGFKQINHTRKNQSNNMELLNQLDLQISGLENLTTPCMDSLNDVSKKAISYLQVNCSHCHSPGHTNFQTTGLSLEPCDIVERLSGKLPKVFIETDLSIQILHPGVPEKSLLYQLLKIEDDDSRKQMPLLGVSKPDIQGREWIKQWILNLPTP